MTMNGAPSHAGSGSNRAGAVGMPTARSASCRSTCTPRSYSGNRPSPAGGSRRTSARRRPVGQTAVTNDVSLDSPTAGRVSGSTTASAASGSWTRIQRSIPARIVSSSRAPDAIATVTSRVAAAF